MGNKNSLEHHHGGPSPSSTATHLPSPHSNGGTANWRTQQQSNNNKEWSRRGSGGEEGSKRNSSRLSPAPPPPMAGASSAASSASAAMPNANSVAAAGAGSNKSSAPGTPRGDEGRKGGFLAQLFQGGTLGRKGGAKKATANGQPLQQQSSCRSAPQSPMAPNPSSRPQQNGGLAEHFQLLPDRPAIRLDSRLVCKYEVLSVVGKGSFSQVLRVQDRITKRFFAVKLVSTDQDFGAVNNELTILGRVKHPFVIRLEEVFRSATKLFIVMEMASGGEMYDRVVAKGRYTESEARLAIKMLLTGLDYLHRNLITHRDLKPENLLYSDSRPDARLLITDFGLAHQARGPDEKMAETCGTPEYIAPEILLRIPYSKKVDCWAVGVIAYILMSGIMPFDDDCRSRLYTHIITANYVYYPQFWSGSDEAKHFVDSLLETSPEHRPSAEDALYHHWVTGQRPKGPAWREKPQRRDWAVGAPEAEQEDDAESMANGTTVQRTKSSRSIRSVTRSDHGHRVDPREVDQLAEDLQRLARQKRPPSSQHNGHQHGGSRQSSTGGHQRPNGRQQPYSNGQVTKNYGVF